MAVPLRLHLRDVRPRRRQTLTDLPPGATLQKAIFAGLTSRCPNCGRGALFVRFWSLRVRDRCEACGFDLRKVDTGDGPAVFVTLIGGAIAVFGMLFTEMAFHPPIWVHFVFWLPATVLLCVGLLKPFKGMLVAAQFHNRASQAGG